MCGILVINDQSGLNINTANLAFEIIQKRGPDKSFINTTDTMFVGQSVLSFTRKDNSKIQQNEFFKNEYIFVFNGEIYNYEEISKKFNLSVNSDTHLLSELLNRNLIDDIHEHLNGMYAWFYFKNDRFSFSVDPYGQKRLFYYNKGGLLIISSEIGPVLKYLEAYNLNYRSIEFYFNTRHFIQGPETAYQDILVSVPGQTISGKIDHISKSAKILDSNQYFIPLEKKVDHFDSVLEAVSDRIAPQCDYVSIASGGIDSSLASQSLINSSRPPKYTIGLVFKGRDEQSLDYQNFSNKDVEHQTIEVSESLYQEALLETYKILKHPLPTHSFASQLIISKFLKRDSVRCVIGGDGGDELFGGYELYKDIDFTKKYSSSPSPYSSISNNFFDKDFGVSDHLVKVWNFFFERNLEKFHSLELANRQSVLDIDTHVQLSSVGLYSADIMSQSYGIEGRNYYLDKDIYNLAKNLNPFLKISDAKSIDTRPFMKKNYTRRFNKPPLAKQGFSGFPNEAAMNLLADNSFSDIEDILGKKIDYDLMKNNRYYEWKILNTKLFLQLCN
jgi:asparagine synthase (glutamine-hydrolysing)